MTMVQPQRFSYISTSVQSEKCFNSVLITICLAFPVSGNCDCPHGFQRYGARCLLLLDEPETFWFAARRKCSSLSAHAHLAVPRSEAENEQVQLAAGDASVWLGVSWRGNTWYGDDGCRKISQEFWASEQPDVTGRVVFNKPPGPDGWHSQRMNDKNNAHRPLCQLAYCYRPDCEKPTCPKCAFLPLGPGSYTG